MIRLSLSEIAEIVGGTLHDVPDSTVVVTSTVEFDSRAITEGGLFLALEGERSDGHDHAASAVAAGAVAVLAARPVGVPAIVVDHPAGAGPAVLGALARLAGASVAELVSDGLTVVGVTGSSGKTSTKDLIRAVLEQAGTTVAPPGSFNNELGHPWTALRADSSTRYLVLELSARGVGHIAELAAIAPPRIGVELNVGTAHLGEFGSRENIATAKAELVQSLPASDAGGVAILNADDAYVAAMASKTTARVVTYGQNDGAAISARDVVLDDTARASFTMVTPSGSASVSLRVHGEHQVGNALAAAAVGLECGMTTEAVAAALSGAEAASQMRMDVRTRADGVTVIDDSYNANPDSVRAALKALVTMSRSGRGGGRRSWAVLGEMAELGDDSIIEHDGIGRLAVRLAVSKIIVVGTGRPSHGLYQGAVMEGSWGDEAYLVADADEALAVLREELEPGDLVLVKASRSVGLDVVAAALFEEQGWRR